MIPLGVLIQQVLGTAATPSSLLTNIGAYWMLDESSGTLIDSTLNTDNDFVTINSTPVYAQPGKRGDCIEFDSGSDYIKTGTSHACAGGDKDFTVCGWIRPGTVTGGFEGYFDCGTGQNANQQDWLILSSTTEIRFYVPSGNTWYYAAIAAALAVDTWIFVMCHFEAATNTMSIEVNNDGVVDTTVGGTASAKGGAVYCGYYYNFATGLGRFNMWGFWPRALTQVEKDELWNDGYGRTYLELVTPPNPLWRDLRGHWILNEAADETRKDLHGQNPMRDLNTVTEAGGEAIFAGTDQYLSSRHPTDIPTGDTSWSVCGFVTTENLSPSILDTVFGLSDTTYTGNASDGFHIGYRSDNDYWDLTVRVGTTRNFVNASTAGNPAAGVRYFLYAYFDSDANEIGISVDNGTIDTQALTGVPNTHNGALTFGRLGGSGSTGYYLTGAESNWWMFNRTLTADEVTEMYAEPTYASLLPPADAPTFVGVTNVNTGQNSSADIVVPNHADTAEGDVMIMIGTFRNMLSIGLPSGGATWEEVESWEIASSSITTPPGGGANDFCFIWKKIAGASEPASYSITNTDDGVDGCCVSLAVFRNCDTVTTPTVAATAVAPEQDAEAMDMLLTFHAVTYDTSNPSTVFNQDGTGLISKEQGGTDAGVALGIRQKLPQGMTGDETWTGGWVANYNITGMMLIR